MFGKSKENFVPNPGNLVVVFNFISFLVYENLPFKTKLIKTDGSIIANLA